jgi:hypothetical protein
MEMPTKVFEQCVQVFEAMDRQAILYPDRRQRIYEGYLTYLFDEIGLGLSCYSTVMHRLQAMHCVEQWSPGSRNVPSRWIILREPSEDLFMEHAVPSRKHSRVKELEDRVERLEQLVAQEEKAS